MRSAWSRLKFCLLGRPRFLGCSCFVFGMSTDVVEFFCRKYLLISSTALKSDSVTHSSCWSSFQRILYDVVLFSRRSFRIVSISAFDSCSFESGLNGLSLSIGTEPGTSEPVASLRMKLPRRVTSVNVYRILNRASSFSFHGIDLGVAGIINFGDCFGLLLAAILGGNLFFLNAFVRSCPSRVVQLSYLFLSHFDSEVVCILVL